MIYGTFLQSPFYWYLIFGRQKTYFSYFDVTELKRKRDFYCVNILHEKQLEHEKHTRRPTRPERDLVVWAPPLGTPPKHVPSLSIASHPYFYVRLRPGRKPTPYFPLNYLRRRRNPSSTSGGVLSCHHAAAAIGK
jgi:hypothetical protein